MCNDSSWEVARVSTKPWSLQTVLRIISLGSIVITVDALAATSLAEDATVMDAGLLAAREEVADESLS